MADHPILFVDDEPNILSAIRRGLRNEFDIKTSSDPGEALGMAEADEFSVIVSDCRMPVMDGIEFLERVSKLCPNAVRIMLTGNADQNTAARAVNKGKVFKFVNKPCKVEELKNVLKVAVKQYKLVTAEQELLENTVKGCISLLGDVLSIAKPEAFGRTSRLRRIARDIESNSRGIDSWLLDTAALLSQLGCIGIDQGTLDKLLSGQALNDAEANEFATHPARGADLINKIPRLEKVAEVIRYQNKDFDGGGDPADDIAGNDIPVESRVLHIADAYDQLSASGEDSNTVLARMNEQTGRFDPALLNALAATLYNEGSDEIVELDPYELELGMIIQDDVKNQQGATLVCRGQEVTATIRQHLLRFRSSGALMDIIRVKVPEKVQPQAATGT